MTDTQLILFLITSIALVITPGQDFILVMTRAVSLGAKAGVVTAAGISTGLLGHTLLAGLGLGAILQSSQLLFTLLKIVGACYLIYLGIKTFKSAPVSLAKNSAPAGSMWRLFSHGAISNLANPKIAIFYFAFLPQFVSVGSAQPTRVILILGAAFALITFLIKAPLGLISGKLSVWLRQREFVQRVMNRICGLILIGLGIRLMYQQR